MNDVNTKPRKQKVLSVFSLMMINVIAVDSIRTLPISAEYGFSLVFFYLIAAVLFFIPIALVTAELATTWPKTGGLYIWVKEAFGLRWGFLAIWLQWIYNVVWYPTILAFMAAAFAKLVYPAWIDSPTYMLITILILFWSATLLNSFGMRTSSVMSTIGAIAGTMIPMIFIVVLGIAWFTSGKPEQITFSAHSFFPDTHHLKNLAFVSALLFGLIGLEMSAVHAEEVKNPQRDYPRALLFSAIIIITSLILGSLAIAMVVPHKQLSLISGVVDAFAIFFNAYNMPWMIPVIVILIIVGGISGVSTWAIGPTKGLLAAARHGCIPPWFQKINKHGAPINILITQALIFTVLSFTFVLFPTVNSSYWLLSVFTAQLALVVYILMFTAAIYLRYSQRQKQRAYKIPGGNIGMWLVAGVGTLTCIAGIIVGFLPPDDIDVGNVFVYEASLLIGIIVLCAPPFIFYSLRKPAWNGDQ